MKTPQQANAPRAKPSSSTVILVLTLAAAAFALAQTSVVPAIGVLTTELDTSTAGVAWVLTGYLISAAVMTPVVGRLGDMFGKRRMMIVVLAVFGLASLVAALAPNIWVMVAARVVMGFGGGIFPLSFGIIGDVLDHKARATALGLISAIGGLGAGIGLILGGVLIDYASWHWIFGLGAILAGLAAVGSILLPKGTTHGAGRIDFVGLVLLAAGLIAPLLALSEGSDWGWTSGRTIGLMAAGLLILVLFVLFERKVDDPLVNVRVLARPVVLITNVATLLIGASMFGVFVLIPQIAQAPDASGYGFGVDATQAGLLLAPACVAMLIAGGFAGRLVHRYGGKIPMVLGTAVSFIGLSLLAIDHSGQGQVIIYTVIVLIGVGLSMSAMPNLIIGATSPEMRGEATGMNVLFRVVGSAIGSQVVAALLASSVTGSSPLPTDSAFTNAFWLAGAASIIAAVVAVAIPKLKAIASVDEDEKEPVSH